MFISKPRSHLKFFLLGLLLFCFCGCINGPARKYLNGNFRYITVETCRQCAWYDCLYGVPAAAVTDVGIIAADTLLVPLDALFNTWGGGVAYWIFWLPLYPVACVATTFANVELPDDNGAQLYRSFWGFRYLDSANGPLKLVDLNTQPERGTLIICNKQRVSEISGQVANLDSSPDNLAVSTFQGQLYWWTRDDAGWQLQSKNYFPSNDALLEYGRQQISEAPADTVADEHWQLLQKLVAQNPVRYGYSSVQFSKENELRYGLYLICPDGTISLICCLQPGDEKPQITFLEARKPYHVPCQ
jgi:hypothetical protein